MEPAQAVHHVCCSDAATTPGAATSLVSTPSEPTRRLQSLIDPHQKIFTCLYPCGAHRPPHAQPGRANYDDGGHQGMASQQQ
jgi:hypothetical protein